MPKSKRDKKGDRRFKCSVADCGKTFYTPQRLAVHQRTHTGEKPFVCGEPGCDKSFTTAGNLKNHRRIHTGERPYSCTYQNCGREFAEYSSLKKHKLTHTGEKPYSCDICGRTFSQVASQKVHMRGHLKIRSNKKDKRQKADETTKQNVVMLRQEDILQYQDFQGSESVVFSQAVGDHVVTVTTQPAEGEPDQLGLQPPEILGVEEVLTSEECIQGDALCGSNTMGANVVVLSQPQEIVSMSSRFTSGDRTTREEVVYDGDLLHSELDHEEIARNINEPDLSEEQAISHHSPVGGTDREVGMDPMMETDDDDSETEVWVEND